MSESMLTHAPDPMPRTPQFAEIPELRAALDAATRVLDAAGITPEAYAALDPASRDTAFWSDARSVWSARSAAASPGRSVLRLTRGGALTQRAFPSPDDALRAAVDAIEDNEGYPQSIEQNGAILYDRAEILRQWEERHMPG